MLKDNRMLALIGAGLLFIGVFLPIVRVPIMGEMNYFQNGSGDGVFVLVFALIAAGLAFAGRVKHVVWPGAASIAIMAFTLIHFQTMMADMHARMATELAGNPFAGLAEAMAATIQLEWGWAVLLLGGALVTAAGVRAWRASRATETGEG